MSILRYEKRIVNKLIHFVLDTLLTLILEKVHYQSTPSYKTYSSIQTFSNLDTENMIKYPCNEQIEGEQKL